MSDVTPIYRSPLPAALYTREFHGWSMPQRFRTVEDELEQAYHSVAVADATPWGKILVEGDHAPRRVAGTLHSPVPGVGAGAVLEDLAAYRLRQDLVFLHTRPGSEPAVIASLEGESTDRAAVTCTVVTHGRAEIRIIGPRAGVLLSRVCGLDFRDEAFPSPGARQTSVAKTRQLVIRCDVNGLPSYSIIGGRSVGRYLWETLLEAGAEWGSLPIGCDALLRLEGTERALARARG